MPLTAVRRLNGFDVVVVQHEYGIYGGPDGADVLGIVDGLTVPTIIVLHTVLQDPTARQRHILLRLLAMADLVVTMTQTASRRLVASYGADPTQIAVIPHGAVDHGPALPMERQPAERPLVLTWGLIGPGKGIEWAIDAMAGLRDLQPRYLVMGRTHPKVAQRDGETYRDGLAQRARAAGVQDIVELDDRYLGVGELAELVQRADVVLLPYDSREQVTSGVLIEAVAAGRPVVSTAFPHAIELLADGTGLVVPQRDPAGDGGRAAPGARANRDWPTAWPSRLRGRHPSSCGPRWPTATAAIAVDVVAAEHGRGLVIGSVREPPVGPMGIPAPRGRTSAQAHDAGGLYEHAEGPIPRRGRGYCVDDVARALVVVCREQAPGELDDLREQYLTFVLAAQQPDGRFHNRRRLRSPVGGRGVGRGLLGPRALGPRHRRRAGAGTFASGRSRAFDRGAVLRSPASARDGVRRARRCGGALRAAEPCRRRRKPLIDGGRRRDREACARQAVAVAGAPAQLRQRRSAPMPSLPPVPRSTPPPWSWTALAVALAARPADPRRTPVRLVPTGAAVREEALPGFDQQTIEWRRWPTPAHRATCYRGGTLVGRGDRARGGMVPRRQRLRHADARPDVPEAASTGWSASAATRIRARSLSLALLSTLQQARLIVAPTGGAG